MYRVNHGADLGRYKGDQTPNLLSTSSKQMRVFDREPAKRRQWDVLLPAAACSPFPSFDTSSGEAVTGVFMRIAVRGMASNYSRSTLSLE